MLNLTQQKNKSLMFIISGFVLFTLYFFQGPILRLVWTNSAFDFFTLLFVLGIGSVLYLCGSVLISFGLVGMFFNKPNSSKFAKYSFSALVFIILTIVSQLFLFK
jgi:hypothetical protein